MSRRGYAKNQFAFSFSFVAVKHDNVAQRPLFWPLSIVCRRIDARKKNDDNDMNNAHEYEFHNAQFGRLVFPTSFSNIFRSFCSEFVYTHYTRKQMYFIILILVIISLFENESGAEKKLRLFMYYYTTIHDYCTVILQNHIKCSSKYSILYICLGIDSLKKTKNSK